MSPIAFIIGSGPRVGASLAQHFVKEGYKVAVGSRNPDVDALRKQGLIPIKIDVADHLSITHAFAEVNRELGPVNVVIFNVGIHKPFPVKGDILSLEVPEWNLVAQSGSNFFIVAKHAVEGFRKVSSGPKTLIATGNIAPWLPPMVEYAPVQLQKKIIAALVEDFISRYEKDGFRFYFASEVTPEQTPQFSISGPAHVTAYQRLISTPEQLQWEQRFIGDGSAHNVKH